MTDPSLLVVALPGIGGSVLNLPNSDGSPGRPLWSAALEDLTLLLHPERLSLAENPRLVPTAMLPSLKPFGVWSVLTGYEGMVTALTRAVPDAVVDSGDPRTTNLDANVVCFPYDFRRGVAEASAALEATMSQRLHHLWPHAADRRAKVVLVCHSLGGLVARHWVAHSPLASAVRAVVTLGTPHRGAPRALDVLSRGLNVGPWCLRSLVDSLRTWTGLADLMPRYPCVVDTRGPGGALLRPAQVPLPWLQNNAKRAYAMHQSIDGGWAALPDPPALLSRVGVGHGTPMWAAWDGQTLTAGADGGDHGLGTWYDLRGDGTIPAFSAIPVEDSDLTSGAQPGMWVAERHGHVMSWSGLEGLINSFSHSPDLGAWGLLRAAPRHWALDLPSVLVAGEPCPIAARQVEVTDTQAEPVPAGSSTAHTTITLRGSHHDVSTSLEWNAGAACYQGTVEPLPAGLYTVLTSDGQDNGAEVVQVLDPAVLEKAG